MTSTERFNRAYEIFIQSHLDLRTGERKRRLAEGHGHAEKLFLHRVWWPTFEQFDDLHPEYEIVDFHHGNRYIDFAYIRAHFRLAIEIDGYGPHLQQMSRWQFADQWRRQNLLVIDGWKILRFSYDDVKEKPRICQQTIQQMFGRWLHLSSPDNPSSALQLDPYEKETYRLALKHGRPLAPADVSREFSIGVKKARALLQQLVDKGLLQPASGTKRIRTYRPVTKQADLFV